MTSPKKDENNEITSSYKKQGSLSSQADLLEESKRLDMKIEETKNKIEFVENELKKNIKLYKSSEGEKKENEKTKCIDYIKRKKNLQHRLNNLYNQQFEIDQSYIKTEYLQDKKEIDKIIAEAKQKQKEIKYKSYDKEMAEVKAEMKEIKSKQDEFMEALLSFNYNLPDVNEEELDLGIIFINYFELENMLLEKANNNEEFEYNLDELCKPNERFLNSKNNKGNS